MTYLFDRQNKRQGRDGLCVTSIFQLLYTAALNRLRKELKSKEMRGREEMNKRYLKQFFAEIHVKK